MPNPQKPTSELVEVTQFEAIVPRGTRQVSWLWRRAPRDGWQHLAALPGAEVERLEPSPQVVWESRVRVTLPYGSWLMRVESRPGKPEVKSALEHLMGARRTAPRRVIRRYFRVGRRGRLVPVPSE
ncbi:MAG: hypothetical protein KIT72_09215 [Polyangiaceae bacterium]|nr:hypothetical protein [Polyangiaceae bacterium]MCW5790588.1 hypothetical protein [Polyangiaceae bacterium]